MTIYNFVYEFHRKEGREEGDMDYIDLKEGWRGSVRNMGILVANFTDLVQSPCRNQKLGNPASKALIPYLC